jgi:hypothetical protein
LHGAAELKTAGLLEQVVLRASAAAAAATGAAASHGGATRRRAERRSRGTITGDALEGEHRPRFLDECGRRDRRGRCHRRARGGLRLGRCGRLGQSGFHGATLPEARPLDNPPQRPHRVLGER